MNIALILAGGTGTRMGKVKQFLPLGKKDVIMYSVDSFCKHSEIDEVYIVLNNLTYYIKSNAKIKGIIQGGATRQESSFIGISEIIKTHNEDDIILIHDAARPFITEKIITDSIKAVKQYGACATAIQSTDTVFACKDDCVESVLNRENIYLAQTPQGFYLGDIYKAHLNNTMQATDDVSLYLSLGKKVKLIEGDTKNFKLTTMDDYKIAKSLLE